MMASDHTSGRTSLLAAPRSGRGGARVAGRVRLRPEQSVDVPFRNRRVVVIGAATMAMIAAAAPIADVVRTWSTTGGWQQPAD
jgi:hypothetical protein